MTAQETQKAQEIAKFALGRGITDPEQAVEAWFKHVTDFSIFAEQNKSEVMDALHRMAAA